MADFHPIGAEVAVRGILTPFAVEAEDGVEVGGDTGVAARTGGGWGLFDALAFDDKFFVAFVVDDDDSAVVLVTETTGVFKGKGYHRVVFIKSVELSKGIEDHNIRLVFADEVVKIVVAALRAEVVESKRGAVAGVEDEVVPDVLADAAVFVEFSKALVAPNRAKLGVYVENAASAIDGPVGFVIASVVAAVGAEEGFAFGEGDGEVEHEDGLAGGCFCEDFHRPCDGKEHVANERGLEGGFVASQQVGLKDRQSSSLLWAHPLG